MPSPLSSRHLCSHPTPIPPDHPRSSQLSSHHSAEQSSLDTAASPPKLPNQGFEVVGSTKPPPPHPRPLHNRMGPTFLGRWVLSVLYVSGDQTQGHRASKRVY